MWRKFIKVRTSLVIESRNISFTCSSHKFWPGQPQNCTPFHWKVHSLNTKYSFTCPIFLFLVRFKIWDNIILKQIRQRFFYHSDQAVLGIKILLKTKLNFEKRLWKCERICSFDFGKPSASHAIPAVTLWLREHFDLPGNLRR